MTMEQFQKSNTLLCEIHCIKAPLIIGCDVSKMSAATSSTFINPEVITVNEDPLDIQGKKVAFASSKLPNITIEIIVTNCSSLSSIDI
ncbi:unnamed protein product [Adineta steineri]|uniref:Uncharacterized protein n=2 Tax=Adineta steineri TaxID=433720 RepID=A0A818GCB1_9BILA|nr:unnamed protein product [Adineta steineri]